PQVVDSAGGAGRSRASSRRRPLVGVSAGGAGVEPLLVGQTPGLWVAIGCMPAGLVVDLVDAGLGVVRAVTVADHALGDGLVFEDAGREVESVAELCGGFEPDLGTTGTEDSCDLVDELLPHVSVGPVAGCAQQLVDHRVAERGSVLDGGG